jgi:hypothetical protein
MFNVQRSTPSSPMTPHHPRTLAAVVLLLSAVGLGANEQSELRYFGFAGGCGTEVSLQETSPFSNICSIDLTDPRMADESWVVRMMVRGVRLGVSVHGIFFEPVGDPIGGRQLYDLRPDFRDRWRSAVTGKEDALRALAAYIFVADEPSWNGISRSELAAAVDQISADLPFATTATSFSREVDPAWFEGFDVPTDAVGYHHYHIFDPGTDPLFRSNLDLIKTHAEGRGFLYIMDSWWSPEHAAVGLDPSDMAEVARNYYRTATEDPDAVGIVGFHWSSLPYGDGARNLPANARWEYRMMGSEITGKCLAPSYIRPEHALFLLDCQYFATLRYRTAEGIRFAPALPRDPDFGTWVGDQADVIGGLKIVAGDPPEIFPSLYTDLPAVIRVYETATGRLVWPGRTVSTADR